MPVLEWLDGLLEQAVAAARAAYGDEALTDPHRGLYLGDAEVSRLLARAPGSLLLGGDASAAAALAELPAESPVRDLAARFGLSPFEVGILVVALAPELDLRYERLYGYLQDDVTRRRPSVDLALALLSSSPAERLGGRVHFARDAPLLAQALVRLVPDPQQLEAPLLAHALVPSERVVRHVLGDDAVDAALARFAHRSTEAVPPSAARLPESDLRGLVMLGRAACAEGEGLALSFHGPAGSGKRTTAAALAHALGRPLLVADVAAAADGGGEPSEMLRVLSREARLSESVLFLHGLERIGETDRPRWERALTASLPPDGTVVVVAGSEPWEALPAEAAPVLPVGFPIPSARARTTLWRDALTRAGASAANGLADALGARFRLTPGQIEAAVARAAADARRRAAAQGRQDGAGATEADLFAAARAQSGRGLARLARKVERHFTWDDIVLPEDRLEQLREIVRHVKHQPLVFDEWGFRGKLALGRGLSVLFAGPSGTGKTMAAEIVAGELGLDLYKIDLASVVSKYVGETEKNLARIFREAETADAILFFDEADALFGRRTEIRDAHDRYANIEVGYLLQRIEEHEGVVILATNIRKNIDEAFVRRLHFAVEFPFPSEEDRRQIWERVWPELAPRDSDVDVGALARRFAVAGGNIRNIALAAAFLAAEDGTIVGMRHLLHATRREYQKMGKVIAEGEFAA